MHESIPELERTYSLAGWIHASAVPDTTGLVNEISRLTQANAELSNELKRAKETVLAKEKIERDDEFDVFQEIMIMSGNTLDLSQYENLFEDSELDTFREMIDRICKAISERISNATYSNKPNELGCFYYLAHELVLGFGLTEKYSIEEVTFSIFRSHWLLSELVEYVGNDKYCISRKGRFLYQLINQRPVTHSMIPS